ncbi:site-specific DNA-methyltransferase [Nitrospirillum amazonense]|uniref:site-specific DNA-methyltransferase n=1 Tax=Nitrospirillum amazonense TaxID=28077 RepID=UPI0024121E1E|nr:site-specific DNA-methyltransferase [Nitrospirillum amazonense]MDG3444600.1 DNA methyltransferase [Nitrospirillum amazonense]
MLPLIRCLGAAGGEADAADLYDRVAREIGASAEVREAKASFAGDERNLFDRQVRHAQQLAKTKGLIAAHARGRWTLTDRGLGLLENARPGVVMTVFETRQGLAIWGHVEDAAAIIEPGSVSTIYTSPPYPIQTAKPYGGIDTASWISWMLDLVDLWKPLLAPGGSLFMNLGAEVYRRGAPYQSTYLERFVPAVEDRCGFQLAQRWYWDNPHKLGSIQWVSIRRRRLRQTVEPIYWWINEVNGIQDQANNRAVLQPYAEKTLKRYIGQDRSDEARVKPSGIDIGAHAFAKDNGGAIPSTVLRSANSASNDPYRRACRNAGIAPHPATFPASLPERAILMTTRPGDIVCDPFFGSGTVGQVAERLGRRWIGIERSRLYLDSARLRFSETAAA